jgi:hydroxymethylbilane synthase
MGEVDATLLASAGLKRLGIDAGTAIPTEVMLPAPGQAVIGMGTAWTTRRKAC